MSLKTFRRSILWNFLAGILGGILLASSNLLMAQTTAGTVLGIVRDNTQASIPGATVTLKNLDTGIEQRLTTNEVGLYQFPNVPVGRYSVRVDRQGFQSMVRTDVGVTLGATTVVDFTLAVGQVAESVTVTESAEQLDHTSSQLDTHFENRRVSEVPMLGRDVQSLALLAPGVAPTGAGVAGSGVNLVGGSSNNFGQVGTSFSSNGQRARNNNFQIDGIDDNDPARSGGRQAVIQDAVQEFVLIQNNFSAEYGRTSGAIVNLITKAGTNNFHGSLFEFVRNKNLNALTNLDLAARQTNPNFKKPAFDANQVGGSFSGPLVRNKTFFFGAYQYQRIANLAGTSQIFVPTSAGISALQNQVTAGLASAATVGLLQQFIPVASSPVRNSMVNGKPIPVGAATISALQSQRDHNFTVNIDHNFSANDNLRGRFNFDHNNANVPGALPQFGGTFQGQSLLFSLTEVHTFSPAVVNEFRFGLSRSNQQLLFPSFNGLAEVSIRELGVTIGPQTNGDKIDINTNFQWVDNVSITYGKHFMKVGGDIRRIRTDEFALFRGRGQYIFNTFQDFANDIIRRGGAIKTFGPGRYSGRTTAFYTFFQDDFKVRPNLTLNFGVRYEVQTIPGDGYFQGLNAAVQSPVFKFEKVRADTNNFAPRFGFAWSPRLLGGDKTVIRGGFGISYDIFSEIYPILQLPPEFQQTTLNFADVPNFLPRGLVAPPLPTTPEERRARNLGGVPADNASPYAENWTLGIQRQLLPDLMVEAKYVGTRGVKLPTRIQLNSPRVIQPLPQFNRPLTPAEADALPVPPPVNVRRPDPLSGLYTLLGDFGSSNYHSAQFSVNKRFSQGFTINAAYTVSKFIDDVSEPLATTFATPIFAQNFNNLRNERSLSLYDRTQRLVISYVVELPFHKWLGGPRRLTEGWQVSGITTFQDGQPFTVLNGVDSNGDNQSTNDRVRFNPNGTPGTTSIAVPILNSSGKLVGYFSSNPNARYQQLGAQTGLTGNVGRNTERAGGINNFDLTISKKTPLTETTKVEFRAEFFNAFNHPQFGIPTDSGNALSAITSSFVTVSSPNFMNSRIGAGNYRSVQLALRFEF